MCVCDVVFVCVCVSVNLFHKKLVYEFHTNFKMILLEYVVLHKSNKNFNKKMFRVTNSFSCLHDLIVWM